MTERAYSVYLIAGEASGDLLGGGLMHALRERLGNRVQFYGIGGPKMQAQGLRSLFPHEELSLLGFTEVLPHLIGLCARMNQTVEDILNKQPDMVVTIDVPGFCFPVIGKLRKAKIPRTKFVHYVAPTVWMYRPKRAKTCAQLFDHMLTLLPFEPPYFESEGLPTTFVGHPIAHAPQANVDGMAFREKYNIPKDSTVICMMPGSRRSEIQRLMPVFGATLSLLAQQIPNLAIVVPCTEAMLPYVTPYFEKCPFPAIILADDSVKAAAFAASTVALIKSGTAALEVARAGVPMVITYRVNPISAWALRRISQLRFVNLINIISEREVIPELLQELCNPAALATALSALIHSPELQEAQREGARAALAKMDIPGEMTPSQRAAGVIIGLLEQSS